MLSGDIITTIDSLPDEVLFDILVRLAADYLYDSARHVCSRWRRIIRSDAFTATHIQQHSTYGLFLSLVSASPPHSIYTTVTQDGRIETSVLSHMCENKTAANGLVVESTGYLQLRVINPATKQSFLLPSISDMCRRHVYEHLSGIAYSAASMEYKVTVPYYDHGVEQYSLYIVTVGVDKSWRRVEVPPLLEPFRSLFYEFPVSSEGFLHWARWRYCVTLNVETEIFTMSDVPITQYPDIYLYFSTGRSLTQLVRRCKELSWEVWEMKPAESGEWRKVLPKIDLEVIICKLQQEFAYGDTNGCLFPLGWVKYPEVLAFCSWGNLWQTCIFYDLETREINTVALPHRTWIRHTAIVHKNSLVWLS